MTAKILHKMQHNEDPKKTILDAVGDISTISIPGTKILLGTYIRPEKAGSIILPDQFRAEDHFQGKVFLVLKKGAAAFVDDEKNKFHGYDPKEGDWVVVRVAYGLMTSINGHPCKIVEESHIEMVVDRPDLVY